MKTLLTRAVNFATESLLDRIVSSRRVGIFALGSLRTYGIAELEGGLIPSTILRMGMRLDIERGLKGDIGCNASCSSFFPTVAFSARVIMNFFFNC